MMAAFLAAIIFIINYKPNFLKTCIKNNILLTLNPIVVLYLNLKRENIMEFKNILGLLLATFIGASFVGCGKQECDKKEKGKKSEVKKEKKASHKKQSKKCKVCGMKNCECSKKN